MKRVRMMSAWVAICLAAPGFSACGSKPEESAQRAPPAAAPKEPSFLPGPVSTSTPASSCVDDSSTALQGAADVTFSEPFSAYRAYRLPAITGAVSGTPSSVIVQDLDRQKAVL